MEGEGVSVEGGREKRTEPKGLEMFAYVYALVRAHALLHICIHRRLHGNFSTRSEPCMCIRAASHMHRCVCIPPFYGWAEERRSATGQRPKGLQNEPISKRRARHDVEASSTAKLAPEAAS